MLDTPLPENNEGRCDIKESFRGQRRNVAWDDLPDLDNDVLDFLSEVMEEDEN